MTPHLWLDIIIGFLAVLAVTTTGPGIIIYYGEWKKAAAEAKRWKRSYEVTERHRIQARDRENEMRQRALKGGMEIGHKRGYEEGLAAARTQMLTEVGERRIISHPVDLTRDLTDRYIHYLIERSILQLWSDGYGVRGGIVLHRRPNIIGIGPDYLEFEFLVTPKVSLGNEGQQYTWRYQGEHSLAQVHHRDTKEIT